MTQSQGSAGRRLSVMTLDQAVSGASNFALAIAAAQVLGPDGFGLFSIVFLSYLTMLGLVRALVNDPLLINQAEAMRRPGDVVGATLALAVIAAVCIACLGGGLLFWRDDLGIALLLLTVLLPLMLLQDTGRYLGFASGRPLRSLTIDLIWLGLVAGALAALLLTNRTSLVWFVGAWAGAGALAGLTVPVQIGLPRARPSLSWLRATWSHAWRYLMSFGVTQGGALLASLAVTGLVGPAALGGIRAALLLTSPYSTFQMATVAAGIAEVAREAPTARRAIAVHLRRTTSVATVVAVINGALLLLIPDRVGRIALGGTWDATEGLLMPLALLIVMLGAGTGARAGLLGLGRIDRVVRLDVVTVLVLLVAAVVGTILGGAPGYCWAIATTQGLVSLGWWLVFLRTRPGAPPAQRP